MAKAKDKDTDSEVKYLYVRSNLPENEVALHEVDDLHPGGGVLVAGDNVEKVADTPFVRARLRDRWLVEVSASGDKKEADKRAKDRQELLSAPAPERPEPVGDEAPVRREGEGVESEGDEDDSTEPMKQATPPGGGS